MIDCKCFDTITYILLGQHQLGSLLVDDRPITNAVKYRLVSGVVWTNRTMVSSNTDTNRTGVLAVVDIDQVKTFSRYVRKVIGVKFTRVWKVTRVNSINSGLTLLSSRITWLYQTTYVKIDVQQVYAEVTLAVGSQSVRHALEDSEPIADLQGSKNKKWKYEWLLPLCGPVVTEHRLCWGRRNEISGGTGDIREYPPLQVRNDSHLQKSGVNRPGIEPGSSRWEASRLTAQPPHRWDRGSVIDRLLVFPHRRTGFDSRWGPFRISASGNRAARRCRWSAGFLKDLPFPSSLHSGAAPHSPHFILIVPQDLDFKRAQI
ncbi:hypothetical protein PR048_025997 [Dryococelus australis]|uniref:Uncharacterized protein n=1 Tax=Dryococelus australis TaxID=614101 RepID=A0ABQ9GK57_9NEOP|nr:hypothetical protein PR048_025997 [Dryococelus australis]